MRQVRSRALGALLLASGCSIPLYPGPSRPRAEIATLGSTDTRIELFDGQPLGAGPAARYEIVPGVHRVGVSLHQLNPGVFIQRGLEASAVEVYFRAKPGHAYFTAPLIDGRRWEPHVTDEKTSISVSSFEPPRDEDD